jgi:hypothetical protein
LDSPSRQRETAHLCRCQARVLNDTENAQLQSKSVSTSGGRQRSRSRSSDLAPASCTSAWTFGKCLLEVLELGHTKRSGITVFTVFKKSVVFLRNVSSKFSREGPRSDGISPVGDQRRNRKYCKAVQVMGNRKSRSSRKSGPCLSPLVRNNKLLAEL